MNNLCQNPSNAFFHFYADDTVIYCSAPSTEQAFDFFQSAFDSVQSHLNQLRLVVNAKKSKVMVFSNGKWLPSQLPKIKTAEGNELQMVSSYTYSDIITDENLSFKQHIEDLVHKLKQKTNPLSLFTEGND